MTDETVRQSCEKHGTVEISFECERCPLCAVCSINNVIASTSLRVGSVIVGLVLANVPVKLAFPQEPVYAAIGAQASAQINEACQELLTAIGRDPKPSAIVKPRASLIVPA